MVWCTPANVQVTRLTLDLQKTYYRYSIHAPVCPFIYMYRKAYIPLRRKTICVGSWRWLRPPTPQFRVGDTTCRYLKTLKFALPPTQIPKASQWNIGCVGSPTQNFHVGHVQFMLFVLIPFALVTQHEPSLQWNMGLMVTYNNVEFGN